VSAKGVMLITGASRGIGAATARAAVAAGWDVAVNYRSERERAEQLASSLADEFGRRVMAVDADVSLEEEVLAMFDAVESALGPVCCLVNNAGIAPGYGPFADLQLDDIERVWAVNLTGAFLCAREAVRRMSSSRGGAGGSIVNVSSKAAVIGGPGEWIHYAASKAGLETLTAGLSKEVAREGIRVNNVRPGLITGDFGPWAPSGRMERMQDGVPMGRAGEPDEIANAIVWLASDEASYVTGATIDVTGGR
jgi:NAD(P)-dependent dehydrogenase (short-subunit alcohol dehydrogenase family)